MKPTMWLFLLLFLVTASRTCEAQWRWLYPSLRGEFRSCVMASADHAYILTASDSVLETRDQGRTWTTMEVDGLPTFGVFFHPSFGVLVVQERGEGSQLLLSWHILKTSDGGQSWNRLPTTFGDVVDVYFGTDSLGWVTLRTGEGLHTTDGGQTWAPNAPGTPPIIRWMDRNTWYGYRHYTTETGRRDSVLWYSFDGGNTWEERAFTAFPFINSKHTLKAVCLSQSHLSSGTFLALSIAYVYDPKMQQYYIGFSIARSIDTGRTWSTVYQPYLLAPLENAHVASDPFPRAFPSRFLLLRDSVLAVVAENRLYIYRSTDDGQNWSEIDSLYYKDPIGGFDSDHAGSVLAVGTSWRRVQWSTDAGASWSRRDDAQIINTSIVETFLSIHSTGFVIGYNGYDPYFVVIAKNGSQVWDGEGASSPGSSIFGIVNNGPSRSLDDHRILLAETGFDSYRMFELTDSKEWVPLTSVLYYPNRYQRRGPGASYYLGAGRAVFAAENGVIYSHMEDTREWKRVDSVDEFVPSSARSQHMRFFSRDDGVCVSYDQSSWYIRGTGLDSLFYTIVVRTTSDGGRTWVRRDVPKIQFIQLVKSSGPRWYGFAILNAHTYLTTNLDGIRKSTDWGRTWTLVCPTTEGIRCISEVDSLRAFATTEHELLGTTDGGRTWSRITPRDASGRILSAGRFTDVFASPSGFVLVGLPDGFIGGMADSILTGVDRTEPVLPTDPLRIYPNPGISGSEIRVQFSQTKAGPSSLTLYSSLGLRLHHEALSDREPGIRDVSLRTRSLAPGLYFITVSTPEGVKVGKMLVMGRE